MPDIHRTATVNYSTEQMYCLVNDINEYKNFVPWCVDSIVHEQSEEQLRATLTFSAKGIKKSFTTLNKLKKNTAIEMNLIDGPFKYLHGIFKFESRNHNQSEVILELSFELSNKIFAMMYEPLFKQVASSLVDAFVKRAREIYQ